MDNNHKLRKKYKIPKYLFRINNGQFIKIVICNNVTIEFNYKYRYFIFRLSITRILNQIDGVDLI